MQFCANGSTNQYWQIVRSQDKICKVVENDFPMQIKVVTGDSGDDASPPFSEF